MDSVEKEWAHSLIRTERAVNGIKYSDLTYQTINAKKKKKEQRSSLKVEVKSLQLFMYVYVK